MILGFPSWGIIFSLRTFVQYPGFSFCVYCLFNKLNFCAHPTQQDHTTCATPGGLTAVTSYSRTTRQHDCHWRDQAFISQSTTTTNVSYLDARNNIHLATRATKIRRKIIKDIILRDLIEDKQAGIMLYNNSCKDYPYKKRERDKLNLISLDDWTLVGLTGGNYWVSLRLENELRKAPRGEKMLSFKAVLGPLGRTHGAGELLALWHHVVCHMLWLVTPCVLVTYNRSVIFFRLNARDSPPLRTLRGELVPQKTFVIHAAPCPMSHQAQSSLKRSRQLPLVPCLLLIPSSLCSHLRVCVLDRFHCLFVLCCFFLLLLSYYLDPLGISDFSPCFSCLSLLDRTH
ncbi:hypothetical protein VP01_448g3 [Puccinia sorghi]|uniref:Uncharacterized protein n=1 Tax=Puccinia sorghi TaxID=27349 RepID=A0A0L6UQ11_9BASI|nr:hypothetical protein VP01_448g3 [Puccinia sorghi]